MAVVRSSSPTLELWEGRQSAAARKATMINMGLHVFDPSWQGGPIKGRIYSTSFRNTTMKVHGSDEKLTFPVQVCTKVGDVRQALAAALMVAPDSLSFVEKRGCTYRTQLDVDEIGSNVSVRGISSFKATAHKWPRPIAVIGAGYHGLKTCMMYVKSGNTNIVCFDRNDRVGGYCWLTAANKTSKLQTEFGAFHVWWGQELVQETCGYPRGWETWPKKDAVLRHFQFAAEEYGILPYIQFNSNVSKIDFVGDRNDHNRHFDLIVRNVDGAGQEIVPCSVIYNYPGSMTKNRIVEYPGEDIFGGNIGYGMGDGTPYDQLQGMNTAILGNGAFAVENVRTCCEYGANKVYLVTRRKNLASPRLPCWFVHQGPAPTPGRMVLRMFEPMYAVCGFGDPWEFWSVHASQDRQRVTIIQNSRFGIGDVTFLAVAYGKAEYVVDTLKRCTRHTLHLNGGRKLDRVNNLIKSLGLLGDYEVDRLHKMKQMVGTFCDGDWRRVLLIDATGMNAANFSTFSTGIGTTGFVRTHKYLHDFPKEYYRMQGQGLLQQLPVNKARDNESKPAYVVDVKFSMSSAIITESMCPKISTLMATDASYKYAMYHAAHPLDQFLDECRTSWDEYQRAWKEQGWTHEYIPYPYTREMVEGYFREYSEALGFPLSPDGPPEDAPPPGANEVGIADTPEWAADDHKVKAAEEATHKQSASFWHREAPHVFDAKTAESLFG